MVSLATPLLHCPLRRFHDEDQAHAELQASGYDDLRRIQCHIVGTQMTLVGKVSSYFLKQIAQTILMKRFAGTLEIRNGLEVESPNGDGSS